MPKRPPSRVLNWKNHKERWSKCKLCELHKKRCKTVLARGTYPCDVLFVGEAPGSSENVIGKPFIGQAGHLLDRLISDAEESIGLTGEVDKCFTNLIACMPIVDVDKVKEPPPNSIKACEERLNELVTLAKPSALVMVGKHSQKWCPKIIDYDFEYSIDIIHPAAILRMDEARRPVAEERTVVQLMELFEECMIPF